MKKDFLKYANSKGIATTTAEAVINYQSLHIPTANLYTSSPVDSATPYVLEERPMRATQMDVFSRLMMDRQIFLTGPVDDRMCDVVQAQLLFLDDAQRGRDITFLINTPGGGVTAGLSIYDVMNYIASDIATVNLGNCCSMGSVLVSSGTKGKRSTLPHSRIMIHRSSGGAGGHIEDATISFQEWSKLDKELFDILAANTGQTVKKIKADANRDKWFNAEESIEYGLVDSMIKSRKEQKND